ncbi:MAG: arylsulfatase [Chloroflexota bacterium]
MSQLKSATQPSSRPNIILIMADDLGYADIGCFGSEIQTPHLDQMAARGLRFTTMYNAARCCPTRASLLTGLYPHQTGVGHMIGNLGEPAYQGYLRDDCVTIAEVLQQAGYRTLMSGKWHVGGDYDARYLDAWTPGDATHPTPRQRGFDRFYGTLDGAGSFFHPHYLMEDDQRVSPNTDDYYITDAFTDKAVTMIEDAVQDEQPFFLYLAYTAPHWPLQARPEEIAKYEGTYRQGWDAVRTARHEEMLGMGLLDDQWQISPRDPNAPDWQDIPYQVWEDLRMAVYAAQVDRMDQGIGQIMATLRRLAIDENTLVVFLSDNGGCAEFLEEDGWARFYPDITPDGRRVRLGNLRDVKPGNDETFMSYDLPWANVSNAPFRLYKRWVHEGGIATPMVVHWPAVLDAGRIEPAPCHIIDLVPTFLEAAGVTYPTEYNNQAIQPLAGDSLIPLFQQTGKLSERPLFWEHQGNCAIRLNEWKLVRGYEGPWELYNMDVDRTELHDLSQANQPKVTQLASLYNDLAAQCGVIDWRLLVDKFSTLYAGATLK